MFCSCGTYNTDFQYELVTPAATTPISLAEAKAHLRIDPSDTADDTYITNLIKAVTSFGERYTKRDFINKTYRTYRNQFNSCGFEIKRSRLQSVTSIQYFKDGTLSETVDSAIYYNTIDVNYARILLIDGASFPTDLDVRVQAIVITFVAGYGAADTDVPEDIRFALLNHLAKMYENRGDCCNSGNPDNLPSNTVGVYDIYKIRSM